VALREQVFAPFQRLGDTAAGSGVGLGLAVARGFVQAMRGTVEIEDTAGGGTTVIISLPVAAPSPTPTERPNETLVDGARG
jgi:two-component system sensor histidine kinase KdpD